VSQVLSKLNKGSIYNELTIIDFLHYPAKNDDKSKSQNFH